MGEYTLVKIVKSDKPGKKMMAVFRNKKTGRETVTHFGDATMSDYTKHKNNKRKGKVIVQEPDTKIYLAETRREQSYLSYYILWGKSTSLRRKYCRIQEDDFFLDLLELHLLREKHLLREDNLRQNHPVTKVYKDGLPKNGLMKKEMFVVQVRTKTPRNVDQKRELLKILL